MKGRNLTLSFGDQKGFSLIECMIAMVITTIGLLAAAGLIGVGIRLQTQSRNDVAAVSLARSKVEELQNYPAGSPERVPGGSLTGNLSGYCDIPDLRFRRRWTIESGPGIPAGTQRITVTVLPGRADVQIAPVEIVVLAPA